VALGLTAAEWFFGTGARISTLREQQHAYAGRPLLVTYHPSAAIRFGPRGAPVAALRADLATAARLVSPGRRQ
jgi:DNA polymerase